MSNPAQLAQTAREQLAQALRVLQEPELPPELSEVTEAVAEGMSLLHRLEGSEGGALPNLVPGILDAVQRALHQLQWLDAGHPSLPGATEAIAQALSSVFSLNTWTSSPVEAAPKVAPEDAPKVTPQQAAFALAPTVDAGRSAAKTIQHKVTLAAYSPSNFYRGLKGDDVVTHGGLFVATYNVPELGQPVVLWVSLPGGFEFRADGVVRWRRAAVPSGSQAPHAPPGFGVQLLGLSPGAWELIQRYTKNRDPLLYDDA